MSKPVKDLLRKEFVKRFDGVTSLAVVGFTGLDAVTTNVIRGRLREKDIRMSVVKNSLVRQAFKSVGMDRMRDLIEGPCAIAYAADPERVGIVIVVRELLEINRESPALTVKAALLDGEVFGADQIEELSRYPSRDEAIARAVRCVLSGGGNLAVALAGPGAKLVSILKTIEEAHGGGKAGGEDSPGADAPEPDAPEPDAPEHAADQAPAPEAAAEE